jgi:hypothetical protein
MSSDEGMMRFPKERSSLEVGFREEDVEEEEALPFRVISSSSSEVLLSSSLMSSSPSKSWAFSCLATIGGTFDMDVGNCVGLGMKEGIIGCICRTC